MTGHNIRARLVGSAAILTLCIGTAFAQEAELSVPPQPLSEALKIIAERTGQNILFMPQVVSGIRSHGLNGKMNAREAVDHLLQGTNLEAVSDGNGGVVVRRKAHTANLDGARPNIVYASNVTEIVTVDAGGTAGPINEPVESVVVTGSRIQSNGENSPTPLTLVTADELTKNSPTNLPDGLNKLPTFAAAQNSNSTVSGANGRGARPTGNFMDIRGIGPQRTLVLMDGHRVPGTFYDGTVDANMLPQLLVQRVEVVTGGASAVYGSDAVSGVVNFILDKKFEGFKGVFQGGISTYGDAKSFRVGLAGGEDLFDRGHLIWSAEYYSRDAVTDVGTRPYGNLTPEVVGSGTAASPYTLALHVTRSNMAYGGLVTSGPFAGQQFSNGGVLVPFNVGTPTATANFSVGGDGGFEHNEYLTPVLNTAQTFARFDYDFSDNLRGYVQAGYSYSRTFGASIAITTQQTASLLTIYSGNPYLLPQYQNTLTATGTSAFTFNRFNDELSRRAGLTYNTAYETLSTGLEGTIYEQYNWDAHYTHGATATKLTTRNNINQQKLYAALDAVTDPTSGQTVCRVSIVAPGAYPGCVPLNLMGPTAPSLASQTYIGDNTSWTAKNTLDDFAANITGPLFDGWAGPVKGALGAEYRLQSLVMTTTVPDNSYNGQYLRSGLDTKTVAPGTLRYIREVQSPSKGANSVYEGDVELSIPLIKDLPMMQMVTLDGAGRYTRYSTSGSAQTWKIGLDWQVVNDVRIRATRSRDFRAPTLFDLYQQPLSSSSNVNDPLTKQAGAITTISGGNRNLRPEVARNTTAGVVYQPSWLPHFSVSADYFHIAIDNAIAQVSGNSAVTQGICTQSGGTSPLCALTVRPLGISNTSAANFPTLFYQLNENVAHIYAEGIDLEADYNMDLSEISDDWGGSFNFRFFLEHEPTFKTQTLPGTVITNTAGTAQVPEDRFTISLDYSLDAFSVSVLERYESAFHQSADPTQVYKIPNVRAYYTTDLNLSYDVVAAEQPLTVFVNVNNLFNAQGGLLAGLGSPGQNYPVQPGADVIGRYFTVGLRFKN
jgi:iron complex outermembrane receptor protein